MGESGTRRLTTVLVWITTIYFISATCVEDLNHLRNMPKTSPHSDAESVTKLTQATNQFTLDLYRQLVEASPDENLFFSPFSISTALGMTYAGAKGNTEEQMKQVMHLEEVNIHEAFQDHNAVMNGEQAQYKLSTANRLFAKKAYHFLEDYLALTEKFYSASAATMDFSGNPEGSRQEINAWVEDQTEKKIQDLIPSGFISDLTTLILVNAIYFKGNWQEKFDPSLTHKGPFKLSTGEEVEVDFMMKDHKLRPVRYENAVKSNFMEFPYASGQLSLLVALPDKVDGMPTLDEKLDLKLLGRLTNRMRQEEVKVDLPKFKMEHEFGLKEQLSKLGMGDLFTDKTADLSGMDGTKNLFVDQVFHKAFVEINEEGTEAAAATGVGIMAMSLPARIEFKADHPFLFFIRDNRSGALLFMGRYMKPPQM